MLLSLLIVRICIVIAIQIALIIFLADTIRCLTVRTVSITVIAVVAIAVRTVIVIIRIAGQPGDSR